MLLKNNQGISLVEMIVALTISSLVLLMLGTGIAFVVKLETGIIMDTAKQNQFMQIDAHIKSNIPTDTTNTQVAQNSDGSIRIYFNDATSYIWDINDEILYFNGNVLSENVTSFTASVNDNLSTQKGKNNTLLVEINEKKYLYIL